MRWAGRVVLGLWVALSVLTWAPRFGEAADATVTGTGRFVFQKFVHGNGSRSGSGGPGSRCAMTTRSSAASSWPSGKPMTTATSR